MDTVTAHRPDRDDFQPYIDELKQRVDSLAEHGVVVTAADVGRALDIGLPRPVRSRWADRLGPVYTTGQLQRLLPGPSANPITDEAVRARHRAGRLIGFKTANGRWAWPAFQFDMAAQNLRPNESALALWQQLPWQSAHQLELVAWLAGPRADLNGATPVTHVRAHGLDESLRHAAGTLRHRLAA